MNGFRIFIESNANEEARDSINKLPKAHQKLVQGYKFIFEPSPTLKHYPDSVGLVQLDGNKKIIKIASSWFYPNEHAFLHEIGHLVYEKYLANNKKLRKEWETIVKRTKEKDNQNSEELFCHAYATTYSKNKISKHNFPEWEVYIKRLPKN